jgi:hypothetical protein
VKANCDPDTGCFPNQEKPYSLKEVLHRVQMDQIYRLSSFSISDIDGKSINPGRVSAMYISFALVFLFMATGLKIWRKKRTFNLIDKGGNDDQETYKEKIYSDIIDLILKYTSYVCIGVSFALSMIALP